MCHLIYSYKIIPNKAKKNYSLRFFYIIFLFFLWEGMATKPIKGEKKNNMAEEVLRQRFQKEESKLHQLFNEQKKHFIPPNLLRARPPPILPGLPKLSDSYGQKCHFIRKIKIIDALDFSNTQQRKLLKTYEGHCLSLTQINMLLREITMYYIKNSYLLTRAVLMPQKIKNNILIIRVVPAIIEHIYFASNKKKQNNGYASEIFTAFPFLQNNHLNLRDIEQGLEQLNRLESNATRVQFLPGTKLGLSRVQISNASKKPWHLQLGIDNHNTSSSDDNNTSAELTWDSLLFLNDLWRANVQENGNGSKLDKSYTRSQSLYTNVPLGYWTASYFATNFSYKNRIEKLKLELYNYGKAHTQVTALDRVLYRSQYAKTSIAYQNKYRKSKNYIEKALLVSSSRSIQSHSLNLKHRQSINNAAFHSSLNTQWGKLSPVAPVDEVKKADKESSEEGSQKDPKAPQLNFQKINFSLVYNQPFFIGDKHFFWNIFLQAQYSPNILFSSEQLQIGGLHSVRGFRKQSLSGDKGYIIRSEWQYSITVAQNKRDSLRHTFFIAYDLGEVYSNLPSHAREKEKMRLEGYAIGVRSKTNLIHFDFTYSEAIRFPSQIKAYPALWLSLNLRF